MATELGKAIEKVEVVELETVDTVETVVVESVVVLVLLAREPLNRIKPTPILQEA